MGVRTPDRGHTIIPTILFWGQTKLDLTPDELNVLLQIISHWWYAGNDPHPSKDRIAKRMKKHPLLCVPASPAWATGVLHFHPASRHSRLMGDATGTRAGKAGGAGKFTRGLVG